MQNKTSATIRGVQRIEEDEPLGSHYRMVVSLDWQGLRNVTIARFDNGAIFVNNNDASMRTIPIKDIQFLVGRAIHHYDNKGDFPLVVTSKYSLVGANK